MGNDVISSKCGSFRENIFTRIWCLHIQEGGLRYDILSQVVGVLIRIKNTGLYNFLCSSLDQSSQFLLKMRRLHCWPNV